MDSPEPMDYKDSGNNQLRDGSCLKYRGFAIVAIFSTFHPKLKLSDILYADEDRKLLLNGFKKLNYGVVVWDDTMNKETFLQRLKKVSHNPFHSKCETFAMVIITHGEKNGVLYAYDKPFYRQDVCNHFKAGNCSGLKDKLKLFIFHACRGENIGTGFKLSGKSIRETLPRAKLGDYMEKDNLILCSTFEGNVAFAPEKGKGSFFINALSSVLNEEGSKNEYERKHILALITDVIRITASENFSNRYIIKQQPTLVMALSELYYLLKKDEIPAEALLSLTMSKLFK